MKTATMALAILALTTLPALADDDDHPMAGWFEKFRSLEGTWIQQGEMMNGAKVVYRVTAGGSAVVETIFAGSDHEMVTVYHLQGDDLVLTHYCHLGNQPHMKVVEADEEAASLRFECTGLTGGEEAPHMHIGAFVFDGDDHFETRWTLHENGEAGFEAHLDLVRQPRE